MKINIVFNDFVNYAVRGIFIILGIILLSGIYLDYININIDDSTDSMMRVMGAVFVLWGIFRIVMYYNMSKRYKRRRKDDE